jgi:hypothetical protein
MNILRRFWNWYANAVGYRKRPCPFSGSQPRVQSTVHPE